MSSEHTYCKNFVFENAVREYELGKHSNWTALEVWVLLIIICPWFLYYFAVVVDVFILILRIFEAVIANISIYSIAKRFSFSLAMDESYCSVWLSFQLNCIFNTLIYRTFHNSLWYMVFEWISTKILKCFD